MAKPKKKIENVETTSTLTTGSIEYPTLEDVVKVIYNTDIINYVNSHPEFTVAELNTYFKKKGYIIG